MDKTGCRFVNESFASRRPTATCSILAHIDVPHEDEWKGCPGMMSEELKALERAIDEITEIAKGFGLDFYPMRYEICPADIIYTFGAYGMPTRFSHWSFGKSFHRMKLQYDFNLSRIYELVINSNPCYAFLLKGNSLIQNKLIVAHVLAHCDFFKNNVRFTNTSRDMVESMAASAERIRSYELQYGKADVEAFLDHVLAIQEHIDPTLIRPPRRKPEDDDETSRRGPSTPYDDLWKLDEKEEEQTASGVAFRKKLPQKREGPAPVHHEPQPGSGRLATGHSHHSARGDVVFLASTGNKDHERRMGIVLAHSNHEGAESE